MEDSKRLVSQFLRWWLNPASVPDFPKQFVPGFSYRMQPGVLDDADLVSFIERAPPWTDVVVESEIIVDDTATVVASGVDPVTLLRHRATLRIVVRGENIVSVDERVEILLAIEGRTSAACRGEGQVSPFG